MRKRILIGIAALFYYSGLVALARWWTKRSQPCLIILNYHRAAGDNLRRHLLYLRKHYRIEHIEQALAELYTPALQRSVRRQRRIPLALTFDDGYNDNYTYALRLARELQVPMAIYLVPGYIESGRYFWWEEGQHLVERAQEREVVIAGHKYQLEQPTQRVELVGVIDFHLRYAHAVAEREEFLDSVAHGLDVSLLPTNSDAPSLPLTWQQVAEMNESGWIDFGGHTMHHPILAYLSDITEVKYEIATCREVLEQRLGHPIYTFAYPVGQNQHIGETAVQEVRAAGYKWAMTTSYGFNTPRTDPYRLKRIEVDVEQHWLVMAAETAGLWGFLSRLRWLPIVRKYFTNSR